MADANRGLESVKGLLQSEAIDGQIYWFSDRTPAAKMKCPTAFLLSVYDEYISGYKDRSDVVDAKDAAKLIAKGNALTHVIVVDSQIIGTWKRTLSSEAVTIETNLFRRLAKAEDQALATAAERYRKFVGAATVFVH